MKINIPTLLQELGLFAEEKGVSTGAHWTGSGTPIHSYSPVDGKPIGLVTTASLDEFDQTLNCAIDAFEEFRKMPTPNRGELVRQFGILLQFKITVLLVKIVL